MEPTVIDHSEKGLDRIIQALKKENFEKYVDIFLQETQELEDTFISLGEQKSIDIAEGVWLDYIGKIVGESRNNRSDEVYREALKLRIGINRSDGTPNIMIDLVQQATNASSVRLGEGRPAWGVITTNGQENLGSSLWDLVDQIKPAGTFWLNHTDYQDNALQLAWEQTTASVDAFQTTDDGVILDDFTTTDDSVSFEAFFTVQEGESLLGDIERSILAWEGGAGEVFQVTLDGLFFENFLVTTDAGLIEEFLVAAFGASIISSEFQTTTDGSLFEDFLVTTAEGEDTFFVNTTTSSLVTSQFQATTDGSFFEDFAVKDEEGNIDNFAVVTESSLPDDIEAQAGESFMQCGEPDAQCGNIQGDAVEEDDKETPLAWEVFDYSLDFT